MSISRYVWVIEFNTGLGKWWALYGIYHSPVKANQKMVELNSDEYRLSKVKLK